MVKDAGFILIAAVFLTIVKLPKACALEKVVRKHIYNNDGLGSYSFEYQISDGSYRVEDGGIITNSAGVRGLVVRGEYGFIDPDGQPHSVNEDVELRRIFPNEFPQDTIRKSGSLDPEHLGRYAELKTYFRHPKMEINSHFEELACYDENSKKVCRLAEERYSPEEKQYYWSNVPVSHVDRRRVYCFMLLCFTEDELDRVVASF